PARVAYAEAIEVVRRLDELDTIEPTPALLQRIRAVPRRHPRGVNRRELALSWWPFEGAFHPALALAAAAALGVVTGSLVVGAGSWNGSGPTSKTETAELVAGDDSEDEGFSEDE